MRRHKKPACQMKSISPLSDYKVPVEELTERINFYVSQKAVDRAISRKGWCTSRNCGFAEALKDHPEFEHNLQEVSVEGNFVYLLITSEVPWVVAGHRYDRVWLKGMMPAALVEIIRIFDGDREMPQGTWAAPTEKMYHINPIPPSATKAAHKAQSERRRKAGTHEDPKARGERRERQKTILPVRTTFKRRVAWTKTGRVKVALA